VCVPGPTFKMYAIPQTGMLTVVPSSTYLEPTYRTSLVNGAYESAMKSSTQNMNTIASIASLWITQRKMREVNVTVFTNGSYLPDPLPTLKTGAPNKINITAINHTTLAVINASAVILEQNGQIVFVPQQPDKTGYDNAFGFRTDNIAMIIPTRYNNVANLSITIGTSGNPAPFALLNFDIDSVLEPPAPGEANMDDAIYASISSSMQNINFVLRNIGKSLSTV